ncbi:site-specific DNA-methyltransferase [Leptospira levettii]|nr:site-specific DNA-methyltransferase [Leptospira levettii]
MSHLLKKYRGKVDLIYIDPPFDSKADYKKKIQQKGKQIKNDSSVFEEKQYTDIWSNDEYLQFMFERLILIRELLSDTGSVYVHCDTNRGHYLKCILNEIFGDNNSRSEIIWQRTFSHSDANRFGTIHDNIHHYSKNANFIFNKQYKPHSEEYIKSHYSQQDKDGRKFRLVTLSAAGSGPARKFGDKVILPPPGRHWAWSQDRIDEGLQSGKLVFAKTGQPNIKQYLDEVEGTVICSLWNDLNPVNPISNELLDYPTQKPEALLERIIKASTNSGDLVFDCFMGSGTTQAVAMKLGRRFLGADINLGAIQTTTKRLLGIQKEVAKEKQPTLKFTDPETEEERKFPIYTGFHVYNVNDYDLFRNPVQAKETILEAMLVDPLPASNVFDGIKDGYKVKVMPVNRIATKEDLNEIIANIDMKELERGKKEDASKTVAKIHLVCMGHDPNLAAELERELQPYKVEVKVTDILRDREDLHFRRDSEAKVSIVGKGKSKKLKIEKFYPLNLMQKLSMQKQAVKDWKELVESVMVDWNYDGSVLNPQIVDIPDKKSLVIGEYEIPEEAGTIRIKITDLLSESWEGTIEG